MAKKTHWSSKQPRRPPLRFGLPPRIRFARGEAAPARRSSPLAGSEASEARSRGRSRMKSAIGVGGRFKNDSTFPRRGSRAGWPKNPPFRNQRAQGMPDAQPHPRPHVQRKKHMSFSHHRSSRVTGIPRAIGFNGFLRALLGEPGLLSPSPARSSSRQT